MYLQIAILFLLAFVAIAVLKRDALAGSRRAARCRRRRRPLVGTEALPGSFGVVAATQGRERAGSYIVRVSGELWSAQSVERLLVGDRCLVLEAEGNRLIVCRLPVELELYTGL